MYSHEEIKLLIQKLIAEELHIDADSIDADTSFHQLGLDSVNSIFLISELEIELQLDIDPMSVYDNPTISSFSDYIYQLSDGAN